MFHELKNEAKITILLHTKSPLSIRSAEGKLLAPDLPDMQCVKSRYQDKYTVIIPGSSLKGVVRTRYEKIVKLFGGNYCNIFDHNNACNKPVNWKNKSYEEKKRYVYTDICPVCQLFGSQAIISKIAFADAYPVGEYVLGERTGVGINRITGSAQKNALYDFEVVEEATFQVNITLKNYELYQMALLMYVLKDLDEGYVSLGSAATRGYGRMEVTRMDIEFREYRKSVKGWKGSVDPQEIPVPSKYHVSYNWKVPFYGVIKLQNLTIDEMIENIAVDIPKKVRRIPNA